MPTPPRDPTRRRFLSTGAAAFAAPYVLGAARAAPRADDPDVLRVGLVGCGGRGTGAALQAVSAESGTVVLTAVADVFPERVEASLANLRAALGEERASRVQVPPEHRFAGFDAFERLLATDVDVVVLATPPHFRPAHLAAAIAAGKHVFSEKPFAVDAPGVRSVLATAAAAEAAGLALVSGFCWRYNVRHRAFYERLHAGHLGAIRAVYSTYNASPLGTRARESGWSDVEFQLRNWQHFCWLSGDHVVEQAVHSLDKMAWAFGDTPPLRVTAIGGRQMHEGEARGNVFDHFAATFDYADGAKGYHMARQMAGCDFDNSDFVHGEKGHGTLKGWSDLHLLEGDTTWEYDGPGNDMYQTEHDEMFASIRAARPINDGVWATRSTMLAIMARMSAYTGKTITWEQAMGSEQRLGPAEYAFGELAVEPVPEPGRTPFV